MLFVCSVDVLHRVFLGIFLFIYFSFFGRGIIEFIGWLLVFVIAVRLSLWWWKRCRLGLGGLV